MRPVSGLIFPTIRMPERYFLGSVGLRGRGTVERGREPEGHLFYVVAVSLSILNSRLIAAFAAWIFTLNYDISISFRMFVMRPVGVSSVTTTQRALTA